jgi:hypothetical protein
MSYILGKINRLVFIYFLCTGSVLLCLKAILPIDAQSEEFLYLANIVNQVTRDEHSMDDQLKALTNWLSENVKKVDRYPEWFDGSTVAKIIKGGVGNCGYQAHNLTALAQFLGLNEFKRYWTESKDIQFQHTFVEIRINGHWGIFDPNMLGYIEHDDGRVMGLVEIVKNPSCIQHKTFERIVEEIQRSPHMLRVIQFAPDQNELIQLHKQFLYYKLYGPFIAELYLYWRKYTPMVIIFSSLLFLGLLFSFHCLKKKRRRKRDCKSREIGSDHGERLAIKDVSKK